VFRKREVEPYVVELNEQEKSAYQRLACGQPGSGLIHRRRETHDHHHHPHPGPRGRR